MMGEEPLEVPPSSSSTSSNNAAQQQSTQQSSIQLRSHTPPLHHHHHHHYRPQQQQQQQQLIATQLQLLDQHHHQHGSSHSAPELSWLSDQQTQQSERERALSRERIVNAYERASTQQQQPGTSGSSNAQVSSGSKPSSNPNTPRRTRHRVDAGEPRGCFNTSNSLPNSLNHHHAWGHSQRNSHFGNRFHPHFLPPGVSPNQSFLAAASQQSQAPQSQQAISQSPHHHVQHHAGLQGSGRSPPGDAYYFQPMKMLSEFISSASAVAAAQAAQHNVTSPSVVQANARENQLLLREMLCKSAAAMAGTPPNNNQQQTTSSQKLNNNNIQKYYEDDIMSGQQENSNSSTKSLKSSKLDGMIGMMMDKLNSSNSSGSPPPPPEVDEQCRSVGSEQKLASCQVENNAKERAGEESADAPDSAASVPTAVMGDDTTHDSSDNASKNSVNSAADLLNNNTTSSSGGGGVQSAGVGQLGGGGGGQTRNKRKKYQPQRSDLVECSDLGVGNGGIEDLEEFGVDDEDMIKGEDEHDDEILGKRCEDDDIEHEEEEVNRRITRSQQRRIRQTADLQDPDEEDAPTDFTTGEIKREAGTIPSGGRVKRKLPEEFLSDIDEDEAMLLRPLASGSRSSAATTNPDDVESMIQEYENEEEEQEAMINDDLQHDQDREQEIGSRRTLPVVRNLMRSNIQREHQRSQQQTTNVKEAPLTRQLLTSERPTSTPPTNPLEKSSILRPSIQTPRHPTPSPSDLPNGLTNPANSFLQQWKENLKTTLMSHINELVDAQFSLLLGGGMLPPGGGLVLPPHLQQRILAQQQPSDDRRSLRESNSSRSLQEPKVEQKRTPPPPQQQQSQNPPRSHTPRDIPQQKPLIHLNGGSVLNTEKLSMIGSPPMNDVKKLPVGRATNSERSSGSSDYPGIPPRFPFMQNNERGMIPGGIQQNGKPSHFSSALVGLSNHHLQQQAVAAAVAANAVAAAAGIENMFDNDGALSLVVGNRGAGGAPGGGPPGIGDMVHGNVTPRKKRHKVTDTRLTPRAVSRLLGQVDTTPNSSTSPLYDHHGPSSSPQGSPHHHANTPIEPRSILQNGTPPPHREPQQQRERTTPQSNSQQQNSDPPRSIFNPFHPPTGAPGSNPFFHQAALAAAAAAGHPLHPSQLARLDSPPMGASLLHPALQNQTEYVERLREMSMEREREHHQERNTRVGSDNVVVRDRGEHHHHHASLREYPSVRGLRDRGTGGGGIMLSNDVLDLIGRAGSAGGSDSGGESGSGAFELGGGGGMYCKYSHTTSTLTPMHLRKAKLMFFWTRYPSSAVIKMYFPDIKFNKNNTAQLVKWFSNFREFYYIQMEKYARQALSEGVKQAEDLVVTTDSELYRVLNLHYNRNNHIEVPSNFRYVVEQTLREFFKSVQAGKDSEQSWKKAIYKIIARLDDPVPEYFKSPNFLEQLE